MEKKGAPEVDAPEVPQGRGLGERLETVEKDDGEEHGGDCYAVVSRQMLVPTTGGSMRNAVNCGRGGWTIVTLTQPSCCSAWPTTST